MKYDITTIEVETRLGKEFAMIVGKEAAREYWMEQLWSALSDKLSDYVTVSEVPSFDETGGTKFKMSLDIALPMAEPSEETK